MESFENFESPFKNLSAGEALNRATRCRSWTARSAWQRKRASRAGCGPIFSTAGRLLSMAAPKRVSREHCWISMRLARPDRNCSVPSTPEFSPTCAGPPTGSTTVFASSTRRWSLPPRWIRIGASPRRTASGATCLLARGEAEAAVEPCFETAIVIARRQGTRSWELRAAISFARFRQSQGRAADAKEQLAPVYGWFTEGFDTRDLKEAKALLNELHA